MSDDMRMTSLHLYRSTRDELHGTVAFSTMHGDVDLKLNDEDCRPILEHCAAAVVSASRRVAESLTSAAMETTAIEHKPEDVDGG